MSSESSYVPLPESAPRRRWLAVACASAGAVAVVALARPGALVASSASLAREDSDWAPTPRPSWHQDDDRIWVSFKPTAPDGTPTPAPTPRPSAPVDADDDYDDDAARTTRHNKLMVPKLMEAAAAKFSDEVSSGEFECAVQFGFCAKASCTRHDASEDGVEIAACACEPIEASSTNYMKFQLSQVMDGFLAQSPLFIDILRGYVDGTFDAAQTNVRVCDGVREGDFYPELQPDRLSFPAPHFLDAKASLGTEGIVESVACSNDLAVALCAGAPCFDNPRRSTRAVDAFPPPPTNP